MEAIAAYNMSSPEQDDGAQSSQKPSAGDPSNPLFIPGLQLYLPPPSKEKSFFDDLFTLFESCSRSNLCLKAKVEDRKVAELFIEDNWVSTGEGQGSRLSKADAATKALDILCEFQPCEYNTEQEVMLGNTDTIAGLILHMKCNDQ